MTDNSSSHNSLEYDLEVKKTLPYYNCFHSETINLVKSRFQEPKTWLDTGCGTGSLVEKALKEFPDYNFFIADPSREMLEICKKKFSTQQVNIIGQFGTAQLKDNIRPDIITAVQSHHYLNNDERKKATKKCFDLLADNGIYITFENIRFSNAAETNQALKRWKHYQINSGRKIEDVNKQIGRFDKNYFPIKISEHLNLMQQTGFKVAELFWLSNMQAGFYGIR